MNDEHSEPSPLNPTPEPITPETPPAGDLETRRRAAAVLEVLGGALTPAEAAEALAISLPRYYLLEARALEGLVAACEPRPRGRGSPEGRSAQALRRENDRLRQDLTRTQALARAMQRASGIPEQEQDPSSTDGRTRRRRRPHARALRAAKILAPPSPPPSTPEDLPGVKPPP
jgi:hypothetical protein